VYHSLREEEDMATGKRLLLAAAGLAAALTAVAPAAATRIAYTSLDLHSHVAVMDDDGTHQLALTSGAVDDVSPAWSPAGTWVVFVRRRAQGNDDLYRIRGSGSGLAQITQTAAGEANPAWSPSGRSLVCEYGGAVGTFEIVVMNTDGTGRRRLTDNSRDDVEPVWAPRSGRIAFTGFVSASNSEIFSIRPDGAGRRRLTFTRAEEHHPDWSATGKIVFVRFRATANDLVVMNADGGEKRVLWSRPGILRATWSPDGSRLAVEVWDGNDEELYAVSANGATRALLTRNDVDDFGPVWAPAGGRIAFTRFGGVSNDVWTMNRDGSGKRRLTTSPRHEIAADWGR
jgi:TolB protein